MSPMQLLDVPAVLPDHSSVTVRQKIGQALLGSLSALDIHDPHPETDLSEGLTFHDMIAPGQVLSDTFQTLPLVILDDAAISGGASIVESSAVPVADMLKVLHLKARNLALSELVLHWSLTDASAPDPTMESSGARKRLRDALIPAAIPSAKPMTPTAPWADLLAAISGPEVHCIGLQQRPEELPAAVRKFLSSERGRKRFSVKEEPSRDNGGWAAKQDKPGSRSATDARMPHKENKGGLAVCRDTCSSMHSAEPKQPGIGSEALVATGIFSKRPSKRPKRSGKKDDASFFFELQTGPKNSQLQEESVPDDASSSSGDSLLGRHGLAHQVEHISMTLSSVHLRLLDLLGRDQDRILKQAAGVDHAVARSGLLSTDALDDALATAKERDQHIPGSQRALLRAYAALAIVKQTAMLLVHYGVRCAHLHLRHHLDRLPGLAVTCKVSAESLAAAYHDVEAGRLQDHPNQEALRRTLTTVSALHPGCKVLLLGDHRAFFTMYRAITDAGMRAYQLDRDGTLLKGGLEPLAVKKAAEAAMKAADCILATYDHVAVREFPLSLFHCIIECISSPFNGKGEAAAAALASAPCSRHVLLDVQVTLEEPKGQQEQPNAGSEDSVHRVIMPRDAEEDVSKDAPSWCLVVNSSPDSIVRSRRRLHNMLMQLEREGAAVLGRHMSCADLALSVTTCCCIWTEQSLKGPAGSLPSILLERVGAQLALVGMAYSKCILCFEGSKAFEPAILACIDEVAVLGKRCGVGLSILTTSTPEETEIAISTAVKTAGKESPTTTAVVVPEILSSRAAFLESFPSLNPFTAAKLAALPCSLQQLLCSTPEEQEQLSQLLPEVPQHIFKLFFKQAASGVPVLQDQAREPFEESSHRRPSSAQSSGSARMLNLPETGAGNVNFLGPSGSVLYFDGNEGVPAVQDEVAFAGSYGGGWDQYLDTGDENGHHQVGQGPAQGALQQSELWKRPSLYRRTGQAHGTASSQAAAVHNTGHPSGISNGLRGTVNHVPPHQQPMHNSYRLEHAHVSQRGGVLWGAHAVQQPPQQHEGWDFQAQEDSRQEAQAWQPNERSYAEDDPRQRQSIAEPSVRQQYRQPLAYMSHMDRGVAFQDPLCGQPYHQPYSTPLYGAKGGMDPDRMHAHSSPYAQRVPPTREMPVLQESSLIYQDGGAHYDRPGRSHQQLGTPLRRQIYRGVGQGHEYGKPMMRSAMPAHQYMDAPCAFEGPVLQAPQQLHQMTAHDYPPRAMHNMPGQYLQSNNSKINQLPPDAPQNISREGVDEFGVSFDVDQPLALDDDALDSDAAAGPYQPEVSMSRGSMVPVSQQPLGSGLTGRGLADMSGFYDMELPADQEDLFSTIEDDSPQRPERQFKKPKFLGYEPGRGYSKQAKLVWRPCGGRQ
ncbi:probable protein SHORTAGE IN CHIASMATA 1 at N-terminal half [Coccomyxa sp. Obi]|nr:probable protein SHORTAGE IN CHIASMATA 1 at N-terminal half [Coccomyxa sp. Obi]